MCGISGIVAKSVERFKPDQQKMIKAMHHRGPDGNGMYSFENCMLGHNRLSIVDLATGDQPMLDDTGKICIVFNGEIYGYKALRKQLDYPFKTESDTELILAMYKKYGVGLLDYLPGMFSFAIWDDEQQLLFAARDRFGEKPFYYTHTDGRELIFASEIKAIKATQFADKQINLQAISRYLNYGYTGPEMSVYQQIDVLPPAHYLIYKDYKVQLSRYWSIPATTTETISLSDAADQFENLFSSAVANQMVADVECCAFLSGGLDSTSVVCAAKKVNPDLKTLAYGYKGETSELPFAKMAADLYQTDHYELLEENVKIEDVFMKLADIYDEPFGDSSAVATYLICKKAKEYCKVVLTGDGADELLGGYVWWYQPIAKQLQYPKNISAIKYGFINGLAVAEKIAETTIKKTIGRKWRDEYHEIGYAKKYPTPLKSIQSRFDNINTSSLQQLGLPPTDAFSASWEEEGNMNDALKFDLTDYMPGDILVKTDRAAMANSIELRSPFLDVELATFCISLPGNYKVTTNADKILLREAMTDKWPEGIRKRHKQGFGLVKNTWAESESVQSLYREYVYSNNSPLYKVIPFKETQQLLVEKPQMLQSLFILALWAEKNI